MVDIEQAVRPHTWARRMSRSRGTSVRILPSLHVQSHCEGNDTHLEEIGQHHDPCGGLPAQHRLHQGWGHHGWSTWSTPWTLLWRTTWTSSWTFLRRPSWWEGCDGPEPQQAELGSGPNGKEAGGSETTHAESAQSQWTFRDEQPCQPPEGEGCTSMGSLFGFNVGLPWLHRIVQTEAQTTSKHGRNSKHLRGAGNGCLRVWGRVESDQVQDDPVARPRIRTDDDRHPQGLWDWSLGTNIQRHHQEHDEMADGLSYAKVGLCRRCQILLQWGVHGLPQPSRSGFDDSTCRGSLDHGIWGECNQHCKGNSGTTSPRRQ